MVYLFYVGSGKMWILAIVWSKGKTSWGCWMVAITGCYLYRESWHWFYSGSNSFHFRLSILSAKLYGHTHSIYRSKKVMYQICCLINGFHWKIENIIAWTKGQVQNYWSHNLHYFLVSVIGLNGLNFYDFLVCFLF